MKKYLANVGIAVGVALLGALVNACGSKSSPSPTVSGLVLSGNATFNNKNETSQLTATASLSDGSTQNVSSSATWASSNSAIATVTSTGLVTAVGNGSATITATYQSKSGTLPISVTLKADPQVAAIFSRLCAPFRARLQITVSEASGNAGMNINSLDLTMRAIGGAIAHSKSYTVGELSAAFGGTNHFNAGQSKVLLYDATYPGGVDTADSTAVVVASFTDDFGNTKTVTVNITFQRDGC